MWGWLKSAFSFVSKLTGKILGKSGEHVLVNSVCDDGILAVNNITEQLLADQIDVNTWLREIRAELKTIYIQQYLLGIGGQAQLMPADYGSIGGMLADQYRYLQNFAQEIAAGNLTPGQIRQRIAMYANSCREGYARARARAHGIPDGALPAFPGDGTSCLGLTRCHCFWDIVERKDRWDCYWRLGVAEHCILCLDHAKVWNPYVIYK